MHNYANSYKSIHANDQILLGFLRLGITKVHVKFYLDAIGVFLRKSGTDRRKTVIIMLIYTKLYKSIHANDPILLNSIPFDITKVYIDFKLVLISSI